MNVKRVVILLLCLFSVSVLGADKLVLLTSLDPDKNRPPLRSSSWNINQKLENIFYDKLTPYHTSRDNIKIIHFATLSDLDRELSDPENKAIFWVSHSNGDNGNGALDKNIIVDFQGKDISEAFQHPSKQLNYLGFVGCNVDYMVKDFKAKGHMSNNENLMTYSSSRKVDARRSLKKSIGHYLYHHFENNLKSSDKKCEQVKRINLTIKRTLPIDMNGKKYITDIKVLQRDHLVGVFPKGIPGDVQEIDVSLLPGESLVDYKLVFDSGIASNEILMGKFEVLNTDYQVFSTRSGRPLGRGRYVFNLKEEKNYFERFIFKNKRNCID